MGGKKKEYSNPTMHS